MTHETDVSVALLVHQVRELTEKMGDMQKEISEIHAMANRWRGGFLVIVAIGGIIGWLFSTFSGAARFFGK